MKIHCFFLIRFAASRDPGTARINDMKSWTGKSLDPWLQEKLKLNQSRWNIVPSFMTTKKLIVRKLVQEDSWVWNLFSSSSDFSVKSKSKITTANSLLYTSVLQQKITQCQWGYYRLFCRAYRYDSDRNFSSCSYQRAP